LLPLRRVGIRGGLGTLFQPPQRLLQRVGRLLVVRVRAKLLQRHLGFGQRIGRGRKGFGARLGCRGVGGRRPPPPPPPPPPRLPASPHRLQLSGRRSPLPFHRRTRPCLRSRRPCLRTRPPSGRRTLAPAS